MKTVLSARQLASQTVRALEDAADSARATQARSYFKRHEKTEFYGVSSPKAREIERSLFRIVRRDWTIGDAVRYCDILIRHRYMESKFIGLLLLSRYRKRFDPDLLRRVESWISRGHCDNWAATDGISTLIIAPLLRGFPGLIPSTKSWISSESLWLRRSALVSLVPAARKGEHLDEAYAAAASVLDNRDDLIHKATGWLLREAGKTDPSRLEAFLLNCGPRIPRTALRYAIEKFPPAKRRVILERTRTPLGRRDSQKHDGGRHDE
jgi:3-methyladenine DNA glycosylase AlkD